MRRSSTSSPKEATAVICRECNREVLTEYQTIEIKRKTKIHICNECLKKMKEEAQRARNSH